MREYFPAKPDDNEPSKRPSARPKDNRSTISDTTPHDNDVVGNCTRCDSIVASTSASVQSRSVGVRETRSYTKQRDTDACVTRPAIRSTQEDSESSSEDSSDLDPKRRRTDEIIIVPDPNSPNDSDGDSNEQSGKDNQSRAGRAPDKDNGPSREKYSKIVSRNGWKTPKGNNSPKRDKKLLPMIAGMVEDDTKEYLVRGLVVKSFKTHGDLEQAVKAYCDDRKVPTEYHRVITFKNNKKTVGCKITIKTRNAEKILSNDFWPKGIKVREWYDKKPSERDRFFESSDESDGFKAK